MYMYMYIYNINEQIAKERLTELGKNTKRNSVKTYSIVFGKKCHLLNNTEYLTMMEMYYCHRRVCFAFVGSKNNSFLPVFAAVAAAAAAAAAVVVV